MNIDEAVQEYQCPGCVDGPFPDCYELIFGDGCCKHCIGTSSSGVGRFFLGLPKGFNRIGACIETKINIFDSLNGLFQKNWEYDMFNIPIWKYLNKHGHTIVRGISPRINRPWIHIFLKNELTNINCLEITQKDIEGMD